MGMIEWLQHFLETDDTKLLYILILILMSSTLDFIIGWTTARLNPEIHFSSSRAVYGIARKIVLFILLILFIPFSLLLPNGIGLGSLYVLYMGYLSTEIFSILDHLGINLDSKDSFFYDFLDSIFKNTNIKEDKRAIDKHKTEIDIIKRRQKERIDKNE